MASHDWWMLLFFVLLCFGAAALGSVWTSSSLSTWYVHLNKPSMNPPNWVFGPVWSVLYLCMAMSAWLVWRNSGWRGAQYALALFLVQLMLNVAWSGLFFGLRQPGAALVEIFFLLMAIVSTAVAFYPFSKTAFWLMVPYAAWVSFASFLNFKIWQLNP